MDSYHGRWQKNAIQQVQGQIRTMKDALEDMKTAIRESGVAEEVHWNTNRVVPDPTHHLITVGLVHVSQQSMEPSVAVNVPTRDASCQ